LKEGGNAGQSDAIFLSRQLNNGLNKGRAFRVTEHPTVTTFASNSQYLSELFEIPWPLALLDDGPELPLRKAPHQEDVVDPLIRRYKPPLLTGGALKHRQPPTRFAVAYLGLERTEHGIVLAHSHVRYLRQFLAFAFHHARHLPAFWTGRNGPHTSRS
jgi:hypothetical protein